MRTGYVRPTVAALLPGSGSDHHFVAAVFAGPLAALGIRLLEPPPVRDLGELDAWLSSLRREHGAGLLTGGISAGAHLAARWAATR
ncbi:MAG TPA: alpha/beta hydrolase, partial [Pseudonocardiaceae bacterium]